MLQFEKYQHLHFQFFTNTIFISLSNVKVDCIVRIEYKLALDLQTQSTISFEDES